MRPRAAALGVVLALVAAGCGSASRGEEPTNASGPRGPAAAPQPGTASTEAPPPLIPPAPAGPGGVYEATAAGLLSPAVEGVPARAYVPNSLANTVDVIDATTFEVVDRFPVGNGPQHVTPSHDMRQLYVANTAGDSLTPVDPMTGKPGPPIPVVDPYNLYFTPDGAWAVVVAERFRRLDLRDARTWELVKSVPIPHAGPDHLDFSADGRYFVISCEFSGWLVKVDTERMEIVGELHVGGSPIDVRLAPDGRSFYVANQNRPDHRDGVHLIDGETMQETGFVETGKGTHGLYFSRDARSLFATNRLDGSVAVLDVATNSVTARWEVPGGSPDMGGVSADGTQFWITGRYHSEVYVIDTRSGALIRRIPVGEGAHGLALFPQPGRFSLGHTGNYR
jgi:YVTN family beta-propeller protein